jgi:hypothetical protein
MEPVETVKVLTVDVAKAILEKLQQQGKGSYALRFAGRMPVAALTVSDDLRTVFVSDTDVKD